MQILGLSADVVPSSSYGEVQGKSRMSTWWSTLDCVAQLALGGDSTVAVSKLAIPNDLSSGDF